VQYVYAETREEEAPPVTLTAEVLAVLPLALRDELKSALESLDSERIGAVIDQVAAHDAKLHKTLSHLAEYFDYPAILRALQKN
jgi:hypothetical protein